MLYMQLLLSDILQAPAVLIILTEWSKDLCWTLQPELGTQKVVNKYSEEIT